MKFYPVDWRSEPTLRICSLAARGLWVELLGLMHEATPRGHLLIRGLSPTDAQLAALVGILPEQLTELIGELETARVFSRTGKGVIYSRRMTKDEKKIRTAVKNGKNGGNPSLCNKRRNTPSDNPEVKDGVKLRSQKPELDSKKDISKDISKKLEETPPDNPPEKKGKSNAKRGTRLQVHLGEDIRLPAEYRQFALTEGHPDPDREWNKFCDYWIAKAGATAVKLDWFATWRNWVRNDFNRGRAEGQNKNRGGSSGSANLDGAAMAINRRREREREDAREQAAPQWSIDQVDF